LWVLACGQVSAQTPTGDGSPGQAIVGDWLVASRDAIIRIEQQGDAYVGTIVWQLHDTYGPEDGPALNGKTVTDLHNPNPALRSRPLTGLRLLWGLRYDVAEKTWVDGFVYNSDNGKEYHCQIHLSSPDQLVLHGYIGITLLGGNTRWTRTHEPFPAPSGSVSTAH
jgi:uncharacterized protein (DUF2147 family)